MECSGKTIMTRPYTFIVTKTRRSVQSGSRVGPADRTQRGRGNGRIGSKRATQVVGKLTQNIRRGKSNSGTCSHDGELEHDGQNLVAGVLGLCCVGSPHQYGGSYRVFGIVCD